MCKIDGKMNGELYESILKDKLKKSVDQYGQNIQDIIFQHDNDPKHTSKLAKNWFEDHGFRVLTWPAQSPDLNPIEHIWKNLKKRTSSYDEAPSGVWELWERIKNEWNGISMEECQKLIESMPRRIEAVVNAKGGHTKY